MIRVGNDGCWEWTGTVNSDGYGKKGNAYAHRLAYQRFVGPIPEGLELDHLCRNRRCCNPAHLEPVTHAENLRRGTGPAGTNARKMECVNGHPFDGANTYVDPGGGRHCRTCRAARAKARATA